MSDRSSPLKKQSTSNTPSRASSRPSNPTNYEFINSQDPDTRSQIQRHTAHHAAQQRRHLQTQALREGLRRHNFEWQRRPGFEIATSQDPSPLSSNSSQSQSELPAATTVSGISPLREGRANPLSRTASSELVAGTFALAIDTVWQEPAESPRIYTPFEESMLEYYLSTRCEKNSHAHYFRRLVSGARSDDASIYLLVAYAAAQRAVTYTSPDAAEDLSISVDYKFRSMSIVNSRLSHAHYAASDDNIRVVLYLLAFENRFGSHEDAEIHHGGLRRMIYERGGLSAFGNNPWLELQLWWSEMTGTGIMNLDCAPDHNESVLGLEASYTGALFRLNGSLIQVEESNLPSLCDRTIETLKVFQSGEHLESMRMILVPGSPLHQICSYTVRTPGSADHVQLRSLLNVFYQCRLACLLYLNSCIYNSASLEESRAFLGQILDNYREDFPSGESLYGLLWTFTYSFSFNGLRHSGTTQLVLSIMTIARRLSQPTWALVEEILMHSISEERGRGRERRVALDVPAFRREVLGDTTGPA